MADCIDEALQDRGACFLRFHGILAIGRTLGHAFNAASVVEASADAYLRARPIGEVPTLPPEEVDWLAERWRGQRVESESAEYRGGA